VIGYAPYSMRKLYSAHTLATATTTHIFLIAASRETAMFPNVKYKNARATYVQLIRVVVLFYTYLLQQKL